MNKRKMSYAVMSDDMYARMSDAIMTSNDKKDSNLSTMALGCVGLVFTVVAFLVFAIVWSTVWNAWALTEIWNTYLRSAFEMLPVMSKHGAIALSSVVGFLVRPTWKPGDKERTTWANLVIIFGLAPFVAITTVLMLQLLWPLFN